ncbi:MAG TPA: hypothetical protein PLB49_11810 [Chitinophagaceae bacterium]|nr:hypothetical protein [Chitinophagaceae bacterium]HPH32534.1 hypothetical protein [Chitinophagaceae bacterium]
MRIPFLPFYFSLLFLSGQRLNAQVETDSVMYARDSALDVPTDPTILFFQEGEKTKTPGKLMLLLKNKKTKSLAAFLKSLGNAELGETEYGDYALSDLDKDGRKELLVYNYTGGAHCCDELYIFKYTGLNKYQQVAKLFAGNTIITKEKEFVYDFHEQYGYFFTCFACGYEDTTGAGLFSNSSILLRYQKGKMGVVPGDPTLKKTILDNLEKLGKQPYQPLEDDIAQDDGIRKEIALNLAVYYYSFGRNTEDTRQLFYRYYKHPDARKVWAGFTRQLTYILAQNDF